MSGLQDSLYSSFTGLNAFSSAIVEGRDDELLELHDFLPVLIESVDSLDQRVRIDERGKVIASYSNSQNKNIYAIPVADFAINSNEINNEVTWSDLEN